MTKMRRDDDDDININNHNETSSPLSRSSGRGPVEFVNIRTTSTDDGSSAAVTHVNDDDLTTPLLSGTTRTIKGGQARTTTNMAGAGTDVDATTATEQTSDATPIESNAGGGGGGGGRSRVNSDGGSCNTGSVDDEIIHRTNFHDAVERALVLSKSDGSSHSSGDSLHAGEHIISSAVKKLRRSILTKPTVGMTKSSCSTIPSDAGGDHDDDDRVGDAGQLSGGGTRAGTGTGTAGDTLAGRSQHASTSQQHADGNIPKLNFAGGFLHLGASNELEESVGNFLRQGSVVAIIVWLSLLAMSYSFAPPESFEVLEGAERNANLTVFFILLYTNMSRLLRMAVRDKSFIFVNSGVMTGSLTVQFIALVSISLMIFLPTPVIVDPVTGIRSHLVRWSEWIPLCFLMTFLAESVDMPISSSGEFISRNSVRKPITVAWMHGIALGLSTSAGAVTVLCTTWRAWVTVVGIAWILFCSLFVRLYQRYTRLRSMSPGTTVDEREAYDRAKYGLKTIAVCTVAWTCLSLSWCIIAIMAPRSDEHSIFSNKSLILITESFFEALSKIWYFDLLVDLHNIAFDDTSRTMRRLEELRNFMSAVWDHSSDVLVWGSRASAKEGSCINGIVSPSFFGKEPGEDLSAGSLNFSTLLVEVNPRTGEYRCYTINLSEPITREKALAVRHSSSSRETHRISHLSTDYVTKNISVVADLLCDAFACGSSEPEMTMMKELYYPCGDDDIFDDTDSLMSDQHCIKHCEARINYLGKSSRLIVLRDISERFQRFEIEKKLVEEKTARRKDGEANRFTRHEVKNGILAAIGLVESIRDTKASSSCSVVSNSSTTVMGGSRSNDNPTEVAVPDPEPKPKDDSSQSTGPNDETSSRNMVTISEDVQTRFFKAERRMSNLSDQGSGFEDSLGELDNTLRDILDSIMDHAMSLDVINEVYELRKERVIVPELLSSIRRQANSIGHSRFSIKTDPQLFPVLGLDPRLLRHIYQNALSNACRYGRFGGNVVTSIEYDEETKVFRMNVINEPGFGHESFVTLPKEEVNERVFSQGSRLHGNSLDEHDFVVANSSGDGAWIVKKCASICKGDVSLNFEPNRTVFTFWCPAKVIARTKADGTVEDPRPFSLPPTTWGIVIDDSGIQRKLMDRFLKIAGIEKDRRIIIGKDAKEIYGFQDIVLDTLKSNPKDQVLVIVDENLEVVDGSAVHSTVSGSKSVEKILQSLEPEEETRLLALVRSANDSSDEISMYLSRAHGYLLKEPIDKDGVLAKIRPWWSKRFSSSSGNRHNSDERSNNDDQSTIVSDAYDPFYDIVATLEVLDALCRVSSVKSLRNRWKSIKEKLQVLKGDLKSTISSSGSCESLLFVISEIDSLRLGDFPNDLGERWPVLKSQINAVVHANR